MKKDEEMIVITRTYDLILWSCHHTSRFPRNHRFVLGERIERNLYHLLETLIQAKYTRNRQRLLEDANLALEILSNPSGFSPRNPRRFNGGGGSDLRLQSSLVCNIET